MSRVDEQILIDEVTARTGIGDEAQVRQAIRETLAALASTLASIEIAALADELPEAFAHDLRALRPVATPPRDPFARLAWREGVPEGLAVEYAHVICQVLAEHVGGELRALLHRRLQPPWADLFHPRPHPGPPPAPPHRAPAAGRGHTVATGRPGSGQPVSEVPATRTQSGSVAGSEQPHEDSKLSTGEPRGEPVSTAHPDTHRRISEAD